MVVAGVGIWFAVFVALALLSERYSIWPAVLLLAILGAL